MATAPVTLIALPTVKQRTSLSKSGVYIRMAAGTFPRPIRLGLKSVAWIDAEVQRWIDDQIRAARELKPQS